MAINAFQFSQHELINDGGALFFSLRWEQKEDLWENIIPKY